jgi:antitoxin HigA-1
MLPTDRIPTHPGEMLLEEFLRPLGVTQKAFAKHLGVSLQRLNEIVRGKRGVTAETAWLLAGALDTSPELWTNLQAAYDLARARPERFPAVLPELAAWHEREQSEAIIVGPARQRSVSERRKRTG